jgi:hypothetical protein
MRCYIAAAVCGWALSWSITTPRLSKPCHLFCIAQHNFLSVAIDPALIVEPWGKNSTSRAHFLSQNTAHGLASWNGVFEFFLYWRWYVPPFHGWLLRFRSYVQHPCLIPVTVWFKNSIALLTVSCQKGQHTGLPFHFVFFRKHIRHPVWMQFLKMKFIRHNFVRSDCEICEKCWESDEMVNRVVSWIFSSTARTKSSLTTDGWPLHRSSCTFSRPSLVCLTHLCTIKSLMACATYTSQSWRWMSATFMFLAFKKWIIDSISHAADFLIFLSIVNTQDDV